MNTLIPIEYYETIYYYFLLVVVAFVYIGTLYLPLENKKKLKEKKIVVYILFLFIITYIGTRPISGKYFGDMRTYAETYEHYASGLNYIEKDDIIFDYLMQFCSSVMSVELFFLICAVIYILPLYLATRKFFQDYQFYGFLMIVISMSFWAYGTNGIRNGIATSLFVFALSRTKYVYILLWIIVAILFHKSMIIPSLAFLATYLYNKSKTYFYIWLAVIPLSLVLGSFWESFFLSIGLFEDTKLDEYLILDDDYQEQFSQVGFRWDFLLYSAVGVFTAWYFLIKRNFSDDIVYVRMCNVYLLTNALWILVIRANFSNRFAYLSWFLLGLIIVYPFLKYKFLNNQHSVLGRIILAYFLFTFFMNVILGQ